MVDAYDLCSHITSLLFDYDHEYRYVMVVLWIVGVLGNLVNLVVFGHKLMVSPVNKILWWLSMSDLIELVSFASFLHCCNWCAYMDLDYRGYSSQFHYIVKIMHYSFFLLQTLHTVTVGLNIALAFWRYLAVAHPLRSKIQCDDRSVRLTVAVLYVLSFLSCVPFLFAFDIGQENWVTSTKDERGQLVPHDILVYVLQPTFKDGDSYYFIYNVALRLVPYIVLIIVSVMLILAVIRTNRSGQRIVASAKHARQNQTNLITKMIMVIILMFLITEIPIVLTGTLWLAITMNFDIGRIPLCEEVLSRFLPLALIINSGCNIFCYLILSTQYKKTLKVLLANKFGWVHLSKRELSVTQPNTELQEI